MPHEVLDRKDALCLLQELAAKYGVLLKDAGIALRGLFLINPEVRRGPAAQTVPCMDDRHLLHKRDPLSLAALMSLRCLCCPACVHCATTV